MKDSYNLSKLTIKHWSEEDQPREKLMIKGKSVLSNAELVAILIGSGNTESSAVELSKQILESVNHNLAELSKKNIHDLMKFKGIGEAKAISIIAALELGRRRKETEGVEAILPYKGKNHLLTVSPEGHVVATFYEGNMPYNCR